MALVDYFLKIDGISGESTDAKHKDEIEVESFSWGVSNTATAIGGGGAGAARPTFHDFAFTALVNKSSPNLFLKCASGQHIKQAVLTARTAGDKEQEFLKITLSDVLVSSYQGSGQTEPTDAVALRYAGAQFRQGPPQKLTVTPDAAGTLRYNPKTRTVEVLEGPNGAMTVGSVGGAVLRGVQLFDVRILIGLLTSPYGTANLALTVDEVRDPPPPVEVARIASVESSRRRPRHPRFDVILYAPDDLTLGADDLTRGGRPIGSLTVDPDADPASFTTELDTLLARRRLGIFGIRLQLHGAEIEGLDDDEDDDDDDDDDTHDRRAAGRARAASDDDDDEEDDDDDAPRGDVSASFTIQLVLDTA